MKIEKITKGLSSTGTLCKHNIGRQCKRKVLIINFLISQFFYGRAQNTMDYSVHANIIYHFTKYVDWPAKSRSDDFIIGVIGETMLFDELKKITANKKAGNQRIVVRRFSPSQTAYDCHILFLSEEESGSLRKIMSRTEDNAVLLVCEEKGAASKGACISFNVVSDRLKLEINKNNIDQRGLSIANELLRLGTLVK
jgi:hypothetical protein